MCHSPEKAREEIHAAFKKLHEDMNALGKQINGNPALCADMKEMVLSCVRTIHQPVLHVLRDDQHKPRDSEAVVDTLFQLLRISEEVRTAVETAKAASLSPFGTIPTNSAMN